MPPRRRATRTASPRHRRKSPSSDGTFRADRHKLELELFQRQKQLINDTVEGYTDAFKKYETRYRRTVKTARGPSTWRKLVQATRQARVIVVGDYHTHAQSQRAFFRLLRAQPRKDASIVIALEMVLAKHQRHIDRFLQGKIEERTFLRRIEQATHWPFGPFDAIRPIFDLARERGWRIIGIDHRAAGVSLQERDDFAAERIAEALVDDPEARAFALIGEMHLAPSHLPRSLKRSLRARKRAGTILRVHQNPDAIWFQYAAEGLVDEHEVLDVADHAFALLSASPVVCQQSFLTWLEAVQDGDEGAAEQGPNAGKRNIKHAVRVIVRALGIKRTGVSRDLQIVGPADLSFFEDLAASGIFNRRELREIKKHILASESCYLPKAKMIYLATFSMNHAAEEAAHMLRHLCSGEGADEPHGLVDAFYCRIINEAVAFLGSKIVNPKRKCLHVQQLERMAKAGGDEDPSVETRAARWVVAHKKMEQGVLVPHLAEVFHTAPALFNAVTHMLGYILGDQLYYALSRNRVSKAEARALFYEPIEDEGAAMVLYFELIGRVGKVKPPRRS